MNQHISFTVKRTRFDEDYSVAPNTRETTNFANLARGKNRRKNIRQVTNMINQRCNAMAHWDNAPQQRYRVLLDIISVYMDVEGCHSTGDEALPHIEMLQTQIVDKQTGREIQGIVGNNFSSYIRDYDFSVVLKRFNEGKNRFEVPPHFGNLHGSLFQQFVSSPTYNSIFTKCPVICLSVSENKTYSRLENTHPVLGNEYKADSSSLTERYFGKMGLSVRYFMPEGCVAPLAFYFFGDLLNDYTNIELIATISTMETFQKIYRPEIYSAKTTAGECFTPSLNNESFIKTEIQYDRKERSTLAVEQGHYIESAFIVPFESVLKRVSEALISKAV